MKKILLFLFFANLIQAQTITTSAPTRLDLVHYYSDKLLLEIGVADADGIGFDFSGYTGEFKIKATEGSTANLKNFAVTFTDSVIILSAVADSLTSLRAPRLLFYELILNDGTNDKTWLAGKFNYTNRPSSSQISSLTLAYNTESLSVTVNGITNFSNIVSDSLNRIDDSLAVHNDSSESHNLRILALIDSLNNIYTESQTNNVINDSLVTRDSSLTDHKDAIDSLAEDVTSIPGMISDSIQNNSIDPDSLDDGDVLVADNGNFVNYSPADLRYLLEIQKIDTTANDTTLYLRYNLALGKYESISRWTLMDDVLPPPLALDYLNVYYPWNILTIAENYYDAGNFNTDFDTRFALLFPNVLDTSKYLETETDPVYSAWDKSTGISITESQISDIDHYTDADIDGNESAFNGWDKNSSDDFDGDYLSLTNQPDFSDTNKYVETSETTAWDKDASNDVTTSTNFGGDVSGTSSTIAVTDDSHAHVISNVDNLQDSLTAKLNSTSLKNLNVNPSYVTFDGTNDYYSVTDNDELDFGTGGFSVELYGYYVSTASNQTMIAKGNGSTAGSWDIVFNTGGINFRCLGTKDNSNSVNLTGLHHIVYARSGNNLSFYLDGVLRQTFTGNAAFNASTSLQLLISSVASSWYVNGKYYLVRLFNRVLSASEVTFLYNYGHPELYELPYADRGASQTMIATYDSSQAVSDAFTLEIGKNYTWEGSADSLVSNSVKYTVDTVFTATATSGTAYGDLTGSTLKRAGAVAEYYAHNATSYSWVDASGNNLHGQGSGSPTPVRSEKVDEIKQFKGSIAANTNTALTDIIPKGYRIVSIRAVGSDSLAAIKIGSSSGGEQVVASTTTIGTTPKLLTLATTANDAYSETADVTLYARHDTTASGKTMNIIFLLQKVNK